MSPANISLRRSAPTWPTRTRKCPHAAGKLTHDIEGRPLDARYVVGRRVAGGPDEALPPEGAYAVAEAVLGSLPQRVAPREIRGAAVGKSKREYDPEGRTVIGILLDKNSEQFSHGATARPLRVQRENTDNKHGPGGLALSGRVDAADDSGKGGKGTLEPTPVSSRARTWGCLSGALTRACRALDAEIAGTALVE